MTGKIILGHLDTDTNSNEIPAVRKLIKELGLEGRVFTKEGGEGVRSPADTVCRLRMG
ncbi:MAG: hypothetical protein HQK86_10535 [Nitrospinae bacterium]|nr:hypothetical protein [Nitrospinota bacterium]